MECAVQAVPPPYVYSLWNWWYGTVPRRYPYNFQVSSSCFLHLPPHVTFTSISLPSPPATFSRKSRLGLYLPLSRREIFDFLVPTFSASRSCAIPCSFRTCRSWDAISCQAWLCSCISAPLHLYKSCSCILKLSYMITSVNEPKVLFSNHKKACKCVFHMLI